MFIFHSELRGLVLALHNCIITKWFFDSVFIDFYNTNVLLEHTQKKFMTEQNLKFFFNYLYVCTFTKEYPYTSTVIQKMRSSGHPWHNLIYLCSTHGHKWAVSTQPLHYYSATWLMREILCMPVTQYFLDKRFNHMMMASSQASISYGILFPQRVQFYFLKRQLIDSSSVFSE